MSLVRLLTAGKCLVGFNDSASRYCMRRKNLLPRFGSPKNPFIARPEAANPASTSAAPEAQPKGPQMTPAELAAAGLKETKRLPVITSNGEAKKLLRSGLAASVLQSISQLAGRLNPLLWRSNHPPSARAVLPAFNRSPVQGELYLDNIKVVRNDLNDADVEIVPAGSAVRRKPQPVVQAKDRAGLTATQPR